MMEYNTRRLQAKHLISRLNINCIYHRQKLRYCYKKNVYLLSLCMLTSNNKAYQTLWIKNMLSINASASISVNRSQ